MVYITFVASLMESLIPRLNSGPRSTLMEFVRKKKTLQDEHPTSIRVQGMIYGEIKVKHDPRRKFPIL
jgi:hypothetical protein